MQSHSRSDWYCYHTLLDMHSHSREATGTVTPFDKYAETQSRSDCCAVTVAKRLLPHLVKCAQPQSRSDWYTPFDKYAESQSRSDCYPNLLNMQSHSREATVMPRRRGVAASLY